MKIIEAERQLLEMMRAAASRRLGPEASATEIEALAQKMYEGPKRLVNEPETPRERDRRREAAESTRADLARYGY